MVSRQPSLKFGFEYRRAGNNEIRDRGSSGIFQFVPQYTSLPGVTTTGDGFASFLLGEANSANIQISDQINTRAYYLAGYVQDDWRITSRLTLNLGLALGNRTATTVDRRQPELFRPCAHQPGFRNSRSGHLLGTKWNAEQRVSNRLEQFRSADRFCLPIALPKETVIRERSRRLLRIDREQYDRRHGLNRILDVGEPGCSSG